MPHAARRTVTLRDVAAAAGVSVATASRVLGGSSRAVAPEYERRVLAAASALRYTADAAARAMRRGSEAVTLVTDDLTTPAMGMIVSAMERQATMSGVSVTVSATRGALERQLETVSLLRALRPRALVLTSSRFRPDALDARLMDELRAYERAGGRVVIVGVTHRAFDSIGFDNDGEAGCSAPTWPGPGTGGWRSWPVQGSGRTSPPGSWAAPTPCAGAASRPGGSAWCPARPAGTAVTRRPGG